MRADDEAGTRVDQGPAESDVIRRRQRNILLTPVQTDDDGIHARRQIGDIRHRTSLGQFSHSARVGRGGKSA
ncbi:uncharacterized protein METZ01_LOCUS494624, partial [marine metagenome]